MKAAIDALYACGHSLLEQERYADAACVFRAMVSAAPEDERGWLALGVCHEAVAQPAVAAEMYGVALKFAPRSARCALARARTLRNLERELEASEAYELADDLASDDFDATLIEMIRLEARQ